MYLFIRSMFYTAYSRIFHLYEGDQHYGGRKPRSVPAGNLGASEYRFPEGLPTNCLRVGSQLYGMFSEQTVISFDIFTFILCILNHMTETFSSKIVYNFQGICMAFQLCLIGIV